MLEEDSKMLQCFQQAACITLLFKHMHVAHAQESF